MYVLWAVLKALLSSLQRAKKKEEVEMQQGPHHCTGGNRAWEKERVELGAMVKS